MESPTRARLLSCAIPDRTAACFPGIALAALENQGGRAPGVGNAMAEELADMVHSSTETIQNLNVHVQNLIENVSKFKIQ